MIPKITEIVENELNFDLLETDEHGKKKAKNLIVFVIGGLSLAEIASLQRLELENASSTVVLGSTDIQSPLEFLKTLGSKLDLVKPIKKDYKIYRLG